MKKLYLTALAALAMTAGVSTQAQPLVNLGLVGVGRLPGDSFDQLGAGLDTLGGIFSGMWLDPSSLVYANGTILNNQLAQFKVINASTVASPLNVFFDGALRLSNIPIAGATSQPAAGRGTAGASSVLGSMKPPPVAFANSARCNESR